MNIFWIVLGIAVLLLLARKVLRARAPSRHSDLGFVSHQWLSERRLAQTQDSQR
jgi:hypothetical protein